MEDAGVEDEPGREQGLLDQGLGGHSRVEPRPPTFTCRMAEWPLSSMRNKGDSPSVSKEQALRQQLAHLFQVLMRSNSRATDITAVRSEST